MTPASDLPEPVIAPARHGAIAVRTFAGSSIAVDPDREPPVVVGVSGLNGHSAGFAALVEAIADAGSAVDLQALDLRGRGAASPEGPYGVDAHADDVVALLERTAWDRPVLAGHSFGAHVVAAVARRRPDLVGAVVLIDGGTPRRLPADADRAAVADSVAAGIVANLGDDDPVTPAAVEADTRSLFCDPSANEAVFEVDRPITVVRAGLGVAPGLPPVVPEEAVAELVATGRAHVADELDVDADHFSVLFEPSPRLARAVIEAIATART